MLEQNFDDLAVMIVQNPKLRGEYFANPGKLLARYVPLHGLQGRLLLVGAQSTRALRVKLAGKVEGKIAEDWNLVSFRDSFTEKEVFLQEAFRNPQIAFNVQLGMSVLTYIVGLAFVVFAFLAAFLLFDGEPAQQASVGGFSGLAGIITTLGTVFATARRAIRKTNGDNAQVRVILADFATEIANLRAMPITNFQEAKEINAELRQVMSDAVSQIEKYIEPSGDDDATPGSAEGSNTAPGTIPPVDVAYLDGGRAPTL
jgi:hypothetical protein